MNTPADLSIAFESSSNPPYVWGEIRRKRTVIGRVKLLISDEEIVIKFLTILESEQRRGAGRFCVETLRGQRRPIVAQDVKVATRDFWRKLEFKRQSNSSNYLWTPDSHGR